MVHKKLTKWDKEFEKSWENFQKMEEEKLKRMMETEDKKYKTYEKALGLYTGKKRDKMMDTKEKYDREFKRMEKNLWKNQNKELLKVVK